MVVYRLPLVRCHIPSLIKEFKEFKEFEEFEGEEPGGRIQEAGGAVHCMGRVR
jgi:hypothetical protein